MSHPNAPAGNAAITYAPFMTTCDEGNILPVDDDVPGMVIHPNANASALFAIAQSRIALTIDLLAVTISSDDIKVSALSEVVRSQAEEVLMLLTEGNSRLQQQLSGVTHG